MQQICVVIHDAATYREYVLICLTLQSDQKIDANAWCHVVYTMLPGNMDQVMPRSLGTWIK